MILIAVRFRSSEAAEAFYGATNDFFDVSVEISGDIPIVGAYADDDNGDISGSGYLFDVSDRNNPVQIAELRPKDGAAGDYFGFSVPISGALGKATALVGANLDDDNGTDSGSAYLFDAAASGKCPADFDGSGDVGVKDLLILLGTWGPCP